MFSTICFICSYGTEIASLQDKLTVKYFENFLKCLPRDYKPDTTFPYETYQECDVV